MRLFARYLCALLAIGLPAAGAGSSIALFAGGDGPPAPYGTAAAEAQAAKTDRRAEIESWFATLPRENVGVPGGGAAVLIVKFNDYQCPPCSRSEAELRPVLRQFESEMPGAVRLVVKDFPWDVSCNPQAIKTLHPAACAAAIAVRLAEQHGRGVQMADYLYANQATLTPGSVQQAATWIGSVTNWNAGLPAAMSAIHADVALAQRLQVRSTPTFFVNGVRLPQLLTAAAWDFAIRVELRRAGRLKQ